jgi:hypothetical protein
MDAGGEAYRAVFEQLDACVLTHPRTLEHSHFSYICLEPEDNSKGGCESGVML